MEPNKKINCGIIGFGWWGAQMSKKIIESNCFRVKYIYDSDEKKAKEASGLLKCSVAKSVDDLVSSDIECVFIFTPNQFHAEHAIIAAKHGKHIFLEKPIANNSREGKNIAKICKENGVVLAVGHNVRYYSIFNKAKKIINEGSIGEVVYINGNRSRPIGNTIDNNSWRFYAESCNGGPLIQMAIHIIDAVRFINGLEARQIKKISVKKFLKTENDESYAALLEINNKQLLHIFTSYIAQESFYLNFFGTKGTLYVDPFNGLSIQKQGESKKYELEYVCNSPEIDEIHEFYRTIIQDLDFNNPSVDEAIENVELVEQIINSD